ncbi:Processive diacylglycerol beta-glucosyltransferase [Micromonospora sp. MW-13]|uniref:MGDG synthase family glycosyltransferase n=1 Tax=Micromonospora sp. NBC_01655 TaxID=2975983 RepID=UPI000E435913|nr:MULTISPECIES: glycosyltransferase [unclassified Micromonospora]MCX4472148.1 glycosyltransferase [Micromonospora sp. NBC_01655]RGC67762.1 Processive diacylglycerol beta-glucosyltransferase [Micromonospora sp. MW-13]
MTAEHRGRIVVVSADVGAGHDTAAAELTRRLADQGFVVDRVNFLDLLPRPVRWMCREAYRGVLRWAPWGYDALFAVTGRSRLVVAVLRGALTPLRGRARRAVPPRTRAVVTTYPFANQLFGPLRRSGGLAVPLVTYVTDFVIHPTWVAPGVDVYCALRHARPRTAGPDLDVRTVQPLVSIAFQAATGTSRSEARRRFGLPERGRLALVVAGAWGVGDIEATVADVGAVEGVRTVVVCGRNETLRQRLRRFTQHALGWVDDMPTLMRAVDVVVENAGGLTCQEALSCGLPVVTYRPIPGHGRANAAILAEVGLTRLAPSADHLRRVLSTSGLESADGGMTRCADPAGLVAEVAARPSAVAASEAYRRRSVLDAVGEAVAVLATVLPSIRWTGRR